MVSIVVAVYAVNYAKRLEDEDKLAQLAIRTTYAAEERGAWAMIVSIANRGPGVANRVRISYTGLNAACFNLRLTRSAGTTDTDLLDMKHNADCADGASLVDVRKGKPEELTFIFPREVTGESKAFPMNSYSATCPELYAGEMVWLEFVFKVSERLDAKLRSGLPVPETSTTAGKIEPYFRQFGTVSIDGTDVKSDGQEFNAIKRVL